MTEFVVKDSGERKNFASGMVRDTATGKPDAELIYNGPMADRWAAHLTKGATKYPDVKPGVPNWTLAAGVDEMVRFRKSAVRHFRQWLRGDVDEDHAAAVFFNINGYEYVKAKMAKTPSVFDLDTLPDAPRQSLAEVLEEAARTYPANGVGSQYTSDGGDIHEVQPW